MGFFRYASYRLLNAIVTVFDFGMRRRTARLLGALIKYLRRSARTLLTRSKLAFLINQHGQLSEKVIL